MIFKIIDNIRSKPEYVRRSYAFVTSFVLAFLIFIIWASSYILGFGGVSQESDSSAQTASPLSVIKDDFLKSFGGVFK